MSVFRGDDHFAPIFNRLEHLMARAPEVLGKHYEIAYPGRQWRTARDLRSTPLDTGFRAEGAHMGQFYGWERPLYFNKTVEPELTFARPDYFEQVGREVAAAHERVAIFDLSPFGKIEVEGPDAEAFLNGVCANNVARAPGCAIYTAMLNERGGFESDLTAQRIGSEHYRLFTGTAAIRRDIAWLERHLGDYRVTLRDSTGEFATLALMGPESARVAAELGAPELGDLGYFRLGEARMAGCHVRVVRLSYVGEPGWEITCRAESVATIWAAMRVAGAEPAGLYAQTSMRVEKRFLAMGHDLDADVTPIEAGLQFAVDWDTDFVGRDELLRRRDVGPRARMVSIVVDDVEAVVLGHEPIYHHNRIVGETTSAAFGYRIRQPLALGYVRLDQPDGIGIEIDIAGRRYAATLCLAPAYDPQGERMRRGKTIST